MSVVYQAENPRLLSLIALKVLAPDLANDEVFRTRFREESQIAASLNHPNVIPIHDFGSCDGLLYIAMRYVSGTDLRHLIADHGRLPPQAAVYLLAQAARALDAAHARELVHRDVKPGNLLIAQGREDGDPDHVYLADFGITKHIGGRTGLTIAGTVLGTVHYVSPEQIQDQPVFGAADQYSLGCVLYECLTGRAPFEKSSNEAIMWAHVHERPAAPRMLRPDLPSAIDEVIARVLAKDPGDRYGSCREFIADARAAVAPSRSFRVAAARAFQAAPVPSGGLVQPTVADQRLSAANAAYSGAAGFSGAPGYSGSSGGSGGSGGPTDPREAQRSSGPTAYGDQFDFASEPARSRRVRRRRRGDGTGARSAVSLVAIGASAAVIAGGAAAAGVVLSKTGNVTTPPQATHSVSALYTAVSNMAAATKRLPMSTCQQVSTIMVQCTNPDQSVEKVTFETFPSLTALYQNYESFVGKLAGKPFASVENQSVCGGLAPNPTAESTWNHSDTVTENTAQQMESGKVADPAAMGRTFCVQTATGSENVVWTQDSGHLLAYIQGVGPHHLVWEFYYNVHHFITFPGQQAVMPGMPTFPVATSS